MAFSNMSAGVGNKYFVGSKIQFPMHTVKIYEGSAVFINVSGKALYTASNGIPYVGVACTTVDNSSSIGENIDVYTTGVYEFQGTSLTDAMVGKTAYLDTTGNPNKITTTKPTTSGAIVIALGKIAKVLSSTECLIRIDGFAMKEDVTTA